MDIQRLTLKEQLLLAVSVRLLLKVFFGMDDLIDEEEKVADILDEVYGPLVSQSDRDIDEILELALEIYTKVAKNILEEYDG